MVTLPPMEPPTHSTVAFIGHGALGVQVEDVLGQFWTVV